MNMLLRKETHIQQSLFSNYCRTNELYSVDGLTPNRAHHYRRLVFNVVNDSLQTAFPLTLDLITEDEWDDIVNRFFSEHDCQSYQIWKMPFEFVQFVSETENKLKKKYPLIEELLLFEWIEIEIYMMEDFEYASVKTFGDYEKDVIEFNPEHKILKLTYPVHLKNANQITNDDKGEYYVLVFREKESGRVRFLNLSYYFAWLIEKIHLLKEPLSKALIEAREIFHIDKQILLNNTIPFLDQLKELKFMIGFSK